MANPRCKHKRWEWHKTKVYTDPDNGRKFFRKWKKCLNGLCQHTWGEKKVWVDS